MSLPLPGIEKLFSTQVPEEFRPWVEQALILPLNRFLAPTLQLLDGGLTTGNLNAQVLTKTVTVPDDWIIVRTTAADPGTGPVLANGWVPFDATIYSVPAFRKDGDGTVWNRGAVKNGTANSTFFTYPQAYWPPLRNAPVTISNAGASDILGSNRVDADGTMRQVGGGQTFHSLLFNFTASDRRPVPAACWGANCQFESTLRGSCIGVWPLGAVELDSAKKPSGGYHAGLTVPDWEERLGPDRVKKQIRIRNQLGLAPTKTYLLSWIAVGE